MLRQLVMSPSLFWVRVLAEELAALIGLSIFISSVAIWVLAISGQV